MLRSARLLPLASCRSSTLLCRANTTASGLARPVSWAAANGIQKVMVDLQVGDVGTALPVGEAVDRLHSILERRKRDGFDIKYQKTPMSTIFYATWTTATQIIDEACFVNLRAATPKFAFNMRILAVKDGDHPRSHSIKEELPTDTEASTITTNNANEDDPSTLQGSSTAATLTCGDPSLAVMQTKLTHITINELNKAASSHRNLDRQIGWFVNLIGDEIASFKQEHHQEIFSFSVTTLAGPRPRLFEIWHKAMRACFEKGVDALGFTFQVHTTIDSKLCRPFRRFDRFYSGERKPGDDASD